MEQIPLDCMILLQLTEIEICMGEGICRVHAIIILIMTGPFLRSACIFVCNNSKEHDWIYDNRHTYVEITPFHSG